MTDPTQDADWQRACRTAVTISATLLENMTGLLNVSRQLLKLYHSENRPTPEDLAELHEALDAMAHGTELMRGDINAIGALWTPPIVVGQQSDRS